MPKKTKREKLIAQIHRTSHILQTPKSLSVPSESSFSDSNITPQFQYVIPQKNHTPPTQKKTETIELHAISRDLQKTILLAAGAIAIEFVLYWYTGRT